MTHHDPKIETSVTKRAEKKRLAWFAREDVGSDENWRRQYIGFCLLVLIPTLLAFGISDLISGDTGEGMFDIISGLILCGGIYILRKTRMSQLLFRLVLMYASTVIIYYVYIGAGQGSSFLWVYVFPLGAIFLMGRREGTLWAAGMFFVSHLMVVRPEWFGVYPYPAVWVLRAAIAYIIVSLFAFGFETFREYYFNRLVKEHADLQIALAQVKTLSGLLPICANCKDIRDDEGYWKQIETYIGEHSDARFTHGMCPDCIDKMYPELKEYNKKDTDKEN